MTLINTKLADRKLSSGIFAILFGIIALGTVGLSQDAHAASMTFTTDTTISTHQTIADGETWTVNPGVTLTVGSEISITVEIGGTIDNNGTINNLRTIYNYGTINNNNIFNNDETINNDGTINNYGTINNTGYRIYNNETINNDGTINILDGGLLNHETFNNDGTINNIGGILVNYDTLDNDGIITTYDGERVRLGNEDGGTINNYGAIDILGWITNEGTINNYGAINDYCGLFSGTIPTSENPVVDKCNPTDLTDKLYSDIEGTNLANNVEKSLLGPLKKVVKILDDGKDNDDAACGKLDEFIANVESKEASGKLVSYLADIFIDSAELIQDEIPC